MAIRRWGIVVLTALTLIACAGLIGWIAPDPVMAVRAFLRLSARSSMILFVLAFTASAAWTRWPSAFTQWQRQNRRYLGLSFATSHLLHGLAIITFARLSPSEFAEHAMPGMLVPGLIGYAVIAAMAATSFDRTAAWIGPLAWRRLHLWGSYWLWIQFVIAFGTRVPAMPGYAAFVAILLAALAIRLGPRRAPQPSSALGTHVTDGG